MSGRFADDVSDQRTLNAYLAASGETSEVLERVVADRLRGEKRTVAVTRVSDIVRKYQLPRIDLLKIDVEKAELDVLHGIDDATWNLVDQAVIEAHDIGDRLDRIEVLLRAHGFHVTREHDKRLASTECYNLYAVRRSGKPASTPLGRGTDVFASWSTLQASLEQWLVQSQPGARMPDEFVFCASLPSREGDLDPQTPTEAGMTRRELGPTSATERTLAEVWREILGVSEVNRSTDFFEVGGNSLSAVRLILSLEARYGRAVLEPDVLFSSGRLDHLACAIDRVLSQSC